MVLPRFGQSAVDTRRPPSYARLVLEYGRDVESEDEEISGAAARAEATPASMAEIVLRLQRTAGNRATARLMRNVAPGKPPSATDLLYGIGEAEWRGIEEVLKLDFPMQVSKNLIAHYMRGNGKDYVLSKDEMKQCNALIDFGNTKRSPQFLKMVDTMGKEIAADSSHPGRTIDTDFSFDLIALCNTSGALGDFTVNASGKLSVWNPDEDGTNAEWSFDGNMWWYDYWDFDKRAASAAGEPGRTERGSFRTWIGSQLAGQPFNIKSDTVKVSQARADAKGDAHYAKWEGNPNGEKLPVVAPRVG
jgi:hypothetical protein